MHVFWVPVQGDVNDRYEPLPGFFELPAFLWRKLPRAGRVAVALLGAGLVVLAVVLSPVIQRSKEEHARADAALQRAPRAPGDRADPARAAAAVRARHAGRDATSRARERLVASAAASIEADASRRSAAGEFHGPILRVTVRPVPPSTAPWRRIRRRRAPAGRYNCLAVTSDIPATAGNRAGVVGHPYRAQDRLPDRSLRLLQDPRPPRRAGGARRLARGGAEGLRRLGPQAARRRSPA